MRRVSRSCWSREPHEELVDARHSPFLLELDWCAECGDAAVDHYRDAIAILGLIHVVRRDEYCRAPRCCGVNHLPELTAGDGIDSACRLIEEYNCRLVEKCDGECELL